MIPSIQSYLSWLALRNQPSIRMNSDEYRFGYNLRSQTLLLNRGKQDTLERHEVSNKCRKIDEKSQLDNRPLR